jgi:hypothetical protein
MAVANPPASGDSVLVSFRLPKERYDALEQLRSVNVTRTNLIIEAVDIYINLGRSRIEHLRDLKARMDALAAEYRRTLYDGINPTNERIVQ